MTVPESFKESMIKLLGDEYDRFIASLDECSRSGIRVNTSKISVSDFEKKAPFPIEKIPFIDNGYYINDTDAWSKHPYYFAGLYYIQEPSAMLPAVTIPLDDDSIVLDLCAAPGGKSTGICTRRYGALLSNDISYSRTIPLVKNLELFGAANTLVSCEAPDKLAKLFPNFFDRILVDAPCSGEGMFRKDRGLISAYRQKGPDSYKDIQLEILESAYALLNNGGYILYSTCTYSDIEDEKVVLSFLDAHDDLCVCDIDKKHGLTGPYGSYKDEDRIRGCVHALPHLFCGEGHFMALIKKAGERQIHKSRPVKGLLGYDDLSEEVKKFLSGFEKNRFDEFAASSFLSAPDGNIFLIPESVKPLYDRNIRYARTGTCIGAVNKHGRFTPHTALALAVRACDYKYRISFDADDPAVIKYLKGETVVMKADTAVGVHVLVCVEDHPLGFAVYDGIRFKNLYEKGWLYR